MKEKINLHHLPVGRETQVGKLITLTRLRLDNHRLRILCTVVTTVAVPRLLDTEQCLVQLKFAFSSFASARVVSEKYQQLARQIAVCTQVVMYTSVGGRGGTYVRAERAFVASEYTRTSTGTGTGGSRWRLKMEVSSGAASRRCPPRWLRSPL